jgi:hypothetical protein
MKYRDGTSYGQVASHRQLRYKGKIERLNELSMIGLAVSSVHMLFAANARIVDVVTWNCHIIVKKSTQSLFISQICWKHSTLSYT